MGLRQDLKEHKLCNIAKGWFTSLFIGVPLLVLAFVLPFKTDTIEVTYTPEWYERSIMVVLGLMALLAPNKLPSMVTDLWSIVMKKLGALSLLAVIASSFLMYSCHQILPVETKTIERYRDTTVYVPGENVSASVTDSLMRVLLAMKAEGKDPVVVYQNSPASKTHLTFSLDSLGHLKADCSSDEQFIKFLLKEIETARNTTRIEHEVPGWCKYLIVALLAVVAIETIILIKSR